MARAKTNGNKRAIESYDHRDKLRVNTPPAGVVTYDTRSIIEAAAGT